MEMEGGEGVDGKTIQYTGENMMDVHAFIQDNGRIVAGVIQISAGDELSIDESGAVTVTKNVG